MLVIEFRQLVSSFGFPSVETLSISPDCWWSHSPTHDALSEGCVQRDLLLVHLCRAESLAGVE